MIDYLKSWIPKNWTSFLCWFVVVLAFLILVALGFNPDPAILPDVPVPVFQPSEAQTNGGWHKDDGAVKAVKETLRFKVFGDTPAGQAAADLPDHVYLWEAYHTLFARGPPDKDQSSIGSCVSFGTNYAVATTLAVQIVQAKGDADQFKDPAEEVTYGGSRVQIGKGKLGRGDGSVGAWAAQFVQKWGIVARGKYTSYDLSTYSVSTCRTLGNAGVPADLQKVAKEHSIKDITSVNSWASAKASLASGYAIAICSDQGFSMQRDKDGICRPSGSWAHCMALIGYATINGKEYGRIQNSWGPNAHTGPLGPGDPPAGGFYADSAVVGRMLAQGDSWAFSSVATWPSRKLNWFVQIPRRNINIFALNNRREVDYASVP